MLSSAGVVFALCTSVVSKSELLVREEAGSAGEGFTTAVSVVEGRCRKQCTMVAERGRSVERLSSPLDV